MRINRKSWHYRLMKYMYNPFGNRANFKPPVSLCNYFWELMDVIFIRTPLLIFLSPFVLLAWCASWYARRIDKKRKPKPVATKREPGLIVSYFRAVKNKVCPIIEYHEE